jgi:ComF family protein
MMSRAFEFLSDLLFPTECLNCSESKGQKNPTGFLCNSCFNSIEVYNWLFCPICQQKLRGTKPCPFHKYQSPLTGVGIATDYQNPLVRRLIWSFKYDFIEELAKPLSALLKNYFESAIKENLVSWQTYELVFLPLHPWRERWRGFNQAKILAENLSEKIGLPVVKGLERKSLRKPQMEIGSRKERFENIKGSFVICKNYSFENKNIILVDDVLTSGATLREAAKTLKNAGAKSVVGLVLARG